MILACSVAGLLFFNCFCYLRPPFQLLLKVSSNPGKKRSEFEHFSQSPHSREYLGKCDDLYFTDEPRAQRG